MDWKVTHVFIKRWLSTVNAESDKTSTDLGPTGTRVLQEKEVSTSERPVGLMSNEDLAGLEGLIDVTYF